MAAVAVITAVAAAAKAYSDFDSARKAGRNAKKERERLDSIRAQLQALPPLELERVSAQYPELSESVAALVSKVPVDKLDGTAMADITTDPRLADAQYGALDTLDEISREGMTQSDKYALEDVRQQAARNEAAQRGAALQSLAQRGLGGSGAEISARLLAQQAGANTASQQAMDLARQKRAAALNAVMQRGSMATGMRDQQFGEDSDVARARDAVAQFNAQAQNVAHNRNRDAIMEQSRREDQQAQREWDAKYREIQANNTARMNEAASQEGRVTGKGVASGYGASKDQIAAQRQGTQDIVGGIGSLAKTYGEWDKKGGN